MAETMTKMGSCQLSLVSRSKASSSLANVPMLSRRVKCFSLTFDAGIDELDMLYTELKLTCHKDGAKHEKVGEHLQHNHPHRLVQNRLPLLDLHLILFVVVPFYEGVPNASSSFS